MGIKSPSSTLENRVSFMNSQFLGVVLRFPVFLVEAVFVSCASFQCSSRLSPRSPLCVRRISSVMAHHGDGEEYAVEVAIAEPMQIRHAAIAPTGGDPQVLVRTEPIRLIRSPFSVVDFLEFPAESCATSRFPSVAGVL